MPLVSSSFSLEMLGQLKIFMFNNFKILLLEILSQKQKILPTLEIATRNAKNCTALHHSTIFKNNFFIVRKIATHFFSTIFGNLTQKKRTKWVMFVLCTIASVKKG